MIGFRWFWSCTVLLEERGPAGEGGQKREDHSLSFLCAFNDGTVIVETKISLT